MLQCGRRRCVFEGTFDWRPICVCDLGIDGYEACSAGVWDGLEEEEEEKISFISCLYGKGLLGWMMVFLLRG
jgi:hypothetical protein